MKELLRVGLWGCGGMGNSLANALIATGEACLVAAYDTLPQSAAETTGRCQGQAVASPEELLAFPGLDGVIIALPTYLHRPAAVQAAEAGVHVFLEKPMAMNVAECRQIIGAARAHHIQLMVGQVLRYYEPYRTILRLNAEGHFGRLFSASIWRFSDARKPAPLGHWRYSLTTSGGFLLEVGAHELDMLRCLLGRPQTVAALRQKQMDRPTEWEDYITLQIRFAHGGAGVYEGGSGSYHPRYGFRLMFEQATLESDAAFDPQALRVYTADGQTPSLADEFSQEPPLQAELKGWMAAVRGEAPVPVPGEEGLATVALGEAALRSAQTGQVVAYDLGDHPSRPL